MLEDKHGNSKKDKFTFVDVAPAGFDHLRSVCGMTIVDYLDSLCGLPLTGGAVGEGKSGQFFFFSADRTVMLKTVTHAEWQFMNRILMDYHHHMVGNIDTTLLCPPFHRELGVPLNSTYAITPSPFVWDLANRRLPLL